MSAVGGQNRPALGARASVEAAPTVFRVRWTLSLNALRNAPNRGPELIAAVERWARDGADPVLEWTVNGPINGQGEEPAADAVLKGPGGVVPLFSSNGTTRVEIVDDGATGTRHVEVREGSEVMLSASFDGAGRGALYARTALLARLGLAGGRYEVAR